MRMFWTAILAVAMSAGLLLGTACTPASQTDTIKDPEKLQEPTEKPTDAEPLPPKG